MAEHTPTDEEARAAFVTGEIRDGEGSDWDDLMPSAEADWDRWITAHDARVKAEALREAAEHYGTDENGEPGVPICAEDLLHRAARIEQEASR